MDLLVEPLLIVLGDLVGLLQLLDGVEAVAADVANGDAGGLGVFVRDLDQLLAALLVELGIRNRITCPSVAGDRPRFESTIPFSTALTIDLSQTCTEISRGSGTDTVATWFSGMWLP